MQKIIKLMITDDHQLFRQGLVAIMQDYEDIYLLGDAENGQVLLDKLEVMDKHPDVILMDLNMPVLDGIETTKAVKKKYPNIKIIVLTMEEDEKYIVHLIENGASGYLLKNTDPDEMLEAIHTVVEKGLYFNQHTSQALVSGIKSNKNSKVSLNNELNLTARELEVLGMICNEFTNAEISKKLFISVRTVEGHRSSLLAKTGTRNTAGLVAFALRNELIELD